MPVISFIALNREDLNPKGYRGRASSPIRDAQFYTWHRITAPRVTGSRNETRQEGAELPMESAKRFGSNPSPATMKIQGFQGFLKIFLLLKS